MNAGVSSFSAISLALYRFFDELREVFVNDAVFPIAAQTFEFTDLRLVVHAQT